jgi:Leucine-rich repeat (LRR) protein
LEDLPDSLGECTEISLLNIFNNKLKKIPGWFNRFKKLPKVVNLSNNAITAFPQYLFELEIVT